LGGITKEQATDLLRGDVADAVRAVNLYVRVPITQGQFDALVGFTYNLGGGTLRGSTLLRMLNSGDAAGAADQFARWDHAGGVVVDGLTIRREAGEGCSRARARSNYG
jgi:lysozyme